jgi:rubrerythrin
MRKMTEKNMQEAFAGESQAHIKYLAFAKKAEKEGKPNVARLFLAAAFAEEVHAKEHLRVLSGVGDTEENLKSARAGEEFEAEEMYPAYMAVAELQGEEKAQQAIHHAIEAEKLHRQLYDDALSAVQSGGDFTDEQLVVCSVCGYTATGEAPEHCPVCGAPKRLFKSF